MLAFSVEKTQPATPTKPANGLLALKIRGCWNKERTWVTSESNGEDVGVSRVRAQGGVEADGEEADEAAQDETDGAEGPFLSPSALNAVAFDPAG